MPSGVYQHRKGYKFSKEHNLKISLAKRGISNSKESREKMRKAHLGIKLSEKHRNQISKGLMGNKYCLGKHATEKTRIKLSNVRKGKTYQEIYGDRWEEEIKKRRLSHLKRWDKIGRKVYKRPKHANSGYNVWRSRVYKRDNFTCCICHKIGGILNAHHIKSFAKFSELRYNIDNGITLCMGCHKNIHKK